MSTGHRIGNVSVSKVVEHCGPGFTPEFIYPDWDPALLTEYHDQLVPHCFSASEGRFIVSHHTWIVRTAHHTILIDSCVGNSKDRPSLPRFHQLDTPFLQRLAEAGVHPDHVDFVLCTHLHADHCGWNTRLLDGRWVPTFPNAKYVFSRSENEHWSDPANQTAFYANVYQDSVLPVIEAGQAMIVDSNYAVSDALLLHPTPGHSPGHVAVRLLAGGEEGLFTGDVMHQPVQVFRPGWNSCACSDAEAARVSRRWVLDHAAESRARLFTAHFAQTSAGHVTREGDRFDWSFA